MGPERQYIEAEDRQETKGMEMDELASDGHIRPPGMGRLEAIV